MIEDVNKSMTLYKNRASKVAKQIKQKKTKQNKTKKQTNKTKQ